MTTHFAARVAQRTVLVSLLCAAALGQQQPKKSHLLILHEGKQIGSEDLAVEANSGGHRLTDDLTMPAGSMSEEINLTADWSLIDFKVAGESGGKSSGIEVTPGANGSLNFRSLADGQTEHSEKRTRCSSNCVLGDFISAATFQLLVNRARAASFPRRLDLLIVPVGIEFGTQRVTVSKAGTASGLLANESVTLERFDVQIDKSVSNVWINQATGDIMRVLVGGTVGGRAVKELDIVRESFALR